MRTINLLEARALFYRPTVHPITGNPIEVNDATYLKLMDQAKKYVPHHNWLLIKQQHRKDAGLLGDEWC